MWRTVNFWTEKLTEVLIWSFPKIDVSSVMRIETQGLKNKVVKTQRLKKYLTLKNIRPVKSYACQKPKGRNKDRWALAKKWREGRETELLNRASGFVESSELVGSMKGPRLVLFTGQVRCHSRMPPSAACFSISQRL
jgi:hypothetical protein